MSGRLRHNMRFVTLVPNSLDPVTRAQKLPVPDERPSEKIAKLFPKTDPQKDVKNGARPAEVSATATGKDYDQWPSRGEVWHVRVGGIEARCAGGGRAVAGGPAPYRTGSEGRRHRQLRRYRIRQ